jgi:hypothetical protein
MTRIYPGLLSDYALWFRYGIGPKLFSTCGISPKEALHTPIKGECPPLKRLSQRT